MRVAARVALGAVCLGCGRAGLTLLAPLAFGALALLARRRAQRPIPLWQAALAATAALLLVHAWALAWALAGYTPAGTGPEATWLRAARGFALLGAGAFAVVLFPWPRATPDPESSPIPRRGLWVVAGVSGAWHLYLLLACGGPLVGIDSVVNLQQVPPLRFNTQPPHHPPLYPSLVHLVAGGPRYWPGLWTLVIAQHAAAVGAALAIERTLARWTHPALAIAGGLTIGLDGAFALYAHTISSETFATAFLLLSFAAASAAPHQRRPLAWVLAAAGCLGVSLLTRQVMVGWVVVGGLTVGLGATRSRWVLAGAFAAVALAPVGVVQVHNYVFTRRAAFTASVGRNLIYRVLVDTPPLPRGTDPAQDPWERARTIAWAERERCWTGPYNALQRELGWSDAQIDEAFQRFYREQWGRYPGHYLGQTLAYMGELLVAREGFEDMVEVHNRLNPGLQPWTEVPAAPAPPAPVRFVTSWALPARLVVLLLGALAPLLARPPTRWLAWCAWLSVGYFTLATSLVELPLARYRVPGSAFVVVCAALALDGLITRVRGARATLE